MWTEITRLKHERAGQCYASDLTDAEWAVIEPRLLALKPHGQPVRAIYKIASTIARKSVPRGRPRGLRAGRRGSITAHSASVRSLA